MKKKIRLNVAHKLTIASDPCLPCDVGKRISFTSMLVIVNGAFHTRFPDGAAILVRQVGKFCKRTINYLFLNTLFSTAATVQQSASKSHCLLLL